MGVELEDSAKKIAAILSDLHTVTMPHTGQIEPGKALFYEGKKLTVVECGRKWGKTEILIYSLYRYALCNPGTFSYYFAPQANQIMDLVWANGRLPYYLPDALQKKYIESINHTDKRINFKNGSFIKCDGSDNYEKARGYSATGLTVYDEAKDHNPKFHDAFEPNLAITDSPLLVVGTPGDGSDPLTRLAETAKILPTGAYYNFPSHMNPHISHDFLKRKEEEYKARGEYEVFQIEYLAMRIKLGTKFIFPMLKKSVVHKYDTIIQFLKDNRRDYDFFVSFDPGSAKCFAVLFGAIHRYEKNIILIDEIYANKFGENSVGKIMPQVIKKIEEINPNLGDWLSVYDNAASWFANEVQNDWAEYKLPLFPCTKDINNKETKLSLIKDILIKELLVMTDRCVKTYWEMENYKTDDNGKIVKENDHLMDALRYLLNLANYYTTDDARPVDLTKKRSGTPYQDFIEDKKGEFYGDIDVGLFDG